MRTQFFTGTGDSGNSVVGKRKHSKGDDAFFLLGSLDTLNSWIGFARARAGEKRKRTIAARLRTMQEMLFVAQAEIARRVFAPRSAWERGARIRTAHTRALERMIVALDKHIPPIKKFIIPGSSELSARLDLARAYSRDTERWARRTEKKLHISKDLLAFLNRISSALFALARYANATARIREEHPTYE